ncbi:MAG: hypothetical protein GX061_01175 [Eubacteriaceae bacterium]|nr:hypothetical protein [Eubacteriaceae bacterium]
MIRKADICGTITAWRIPPVRALNKQKRQLSRFFRVITSLDSLESFEKLRKL